MWPRFLTWGGDGEFATGSLASRKTFPMIHVRSLSGASLVERFVHDSRSCIHAELLYSFEVDFCYQFPLAADP